MFNASDVGTREVVCVVRNDLRHAHLVVRTPNDVGCARILFGGHREKGEGLEGLVFDIVGAALDKSELVVKEHLFVGVESHILFSHFEILLISRGPQ